MATQQMKLATLPIKNLRIGQILCDKERKCFYIISGLLLFDSTKSNLVIVMLTNDKGDETVIDNHLESDFIALTLTLTGENIVFYQKMLKSLASSNPKL